MFTKGHTINLGRKNPNAGRKKSIPRQIEEALLYFRDRTPLYLQKLDEIALNSPDNREAIDAIDKITNRVLGKPRQEIDQRVVIGLITPDQLEQATRQPLLDEVKLIAEYSVKQPIVVTDEALQEDST